MSDTRGIPVNVVDDREASRFIVPAVIDRDPVLVAISTGGTSPVLARRLRERLEASIPKRIGELANWLRALRKATREKLRDNRRAAAVFLKRWSMVRLHGASLKATIKAPAVSRSNCCRRPRTRHEPRARSHWWARVPAIRSC